MPDVTPVPSCYPAAGMVIRVTYPFVRDAVFNDEPTWRPGVEIVDGDCDGVADGLGAMVLTVVYVAVLPMPYRPRVFFTRRWVNPDGKEFCKSVVRVLGREAFQTRCRGYAYAYEMRDT